MLCAAEWQKMIFVAIAIFPFSRSSIFANSYTQNIRVQWNEHKHVDANW